MTEASLSKFHYAVQTKSERRNGGGLGKSERSYCKHEWVDKLIRRQIPVLIKRGTGVIIDMHAGDGCETQHPQPDLFAGGSLKTTAAISVAAGMRYGVKVILCESNKKRRGNLTTLYGNYATVIGDHRLLMDMESLLSTSPWLIAINDPNGHGNHGIETLLFLANCIPCSDFIIVVNRRSIQRCLGLTNPNHPNLNVRNAYQSGVDHRWMLDPNQWKLHLGKRQVLATEPLRLSRAMEAQILLVSNWIAGYGK